jgi:hypothetical protein
MMRSRFAKKKPPSDSRRRGLSNPFPVDPLRREAVTQQYQEAYYDHDVHADDEDQTINHRTYT